MAAPSARRIVRAPIEPATLLLLLQAEARKPGVESKLGLAPAPLTASGLDIRAGHPAEPGRPVPSRVLKLRRCASARVQSVAIFSSPQAGGAECFVCCFKNALGCFEQHFRNPLSWTGNCAKPEPLGTDRDAEFGNLAEASKVLKAIAGPRDSGQTNSCRSRRAAGADRTDTGRRPCRRRLAAGIPAPGVRRLQRSPRCPRNKRTAPLRARSQSPSTQKSKRFDPETNNRA